MHVCKRLCVCLRPGGCVSAYAKQSCMFSPAQENPLQLPLKKCAVVGNGGILRHSKCGRDIDQADFIMRWETAEPRGAASAGLCTYITSPLFSPNVNLLCPGRAAKHHQPSVLMRAGVDCSHERKTETEKKKNGPRREQERKEVKHETAKNGNDDGGREHKHELSCVANYNRC